MAPDKFTNCEENFSFANHKLKTHYLSSKYPIWRPLKKTSFF